MNIVFVLFGNVTQLDFAGGHPSKAPQPIVDEIKERSYNGAVQRMGAAIKAALTPASE